VTSVPRADDRAIREFQDSRRDEEASSRMDDEGCPNPRTADLPEAPGVSGGGYSYA
jgi:hypothetical protein